jgi:hypothetical protein
MLAQPAGYYVQSSKSFMKTALNLCHSHINHLKSALICRYSGSARAGSHDRKRQRGQQTRGDSGILAARGQAFSGGRLIDMAVDQAVMAGFAACHLSTQPDSPEFHTSRDPDNEGTGTRAEAAQSGDDLINNDG